MYKLQQIDHVGIRVRDRNRALAFYVHSGSRSTPRRTIRSTAAWASSTMPAPESI
jgi:hypothetical protein